MRTLTEKYLGGLPITEDRYKVDLAVLDRYQSFSAELLRLALLGIAGYGFLIANIAFKADRSGAYTFFTPFAQNKEFLIAGAVALAVSAATALGHRYFSTDCLTHFVRRLRLTQSIGDLAGQSTKECTLKTIGAEENSLERDIDTCRWLLMLSASSLAVGTICSALAFVSTLFGSA